MPDASKHPLFDAMKDELMRKFDSRLMEEIADRIDYRILERIGTTLANDAIQKARKDGDIEALTHFAEQNQKMIAVLQEAIQELSSCSESNS